MNECLICGSFSPFRRICPDCQERLRAGCFGGLAMWIVLGIMAAVIMSGSLKLSAVFQKEVHHP